jgi:hypothetical protein
MEATLRRKEMRSSVEGGGREIGYPPLSIIKE